MTRKIKVGRLVKVTWDDSVSSHRDDPEDDDYVSTQSVGWVTKNTRRGITVSSMKSKYEYMEHTFIPRGCVKKVRVL